MPKALKDILNGVKSSKKLKNDLGALKPEAEGEARWVKKHEIEKHADRVGNGDDVYNPVPPDHVLKNPEEDKHGRTDKESRAVYEETLDEASKLPDGHRIRKAIALRSNGAEKADGWDLFVNDEWHERYPTKREAKINSERLHNAKQSKLKEETLDEASEKLQDTLLVSKGKMSQREWNEKWRDGKSGKEVNPLKKTMGKRVMEAAPFEPKGHNPANDVDTLKGIHQRHHDAIMQLPKSAKYSTHGHLVDKEYTARTKLKKLHNIDVSKPKHPLIIESENHKSICNKTAQGIMCPVHEMAECITDKKTLRQIIKKD